MPTKKVEQEFKVGDWVKKKDGTTIEHEFMGYDKEYKELGKAKDLCGNLFTIVLSEWEHAEPPKEEKPKCFNRGTKDVCRYMCQYSDECDEQKKEEKQKIDYFHPKETYEVNMMCLVGKINELVDAVNELRGEE